MTLDKDLQFLIAQEASYRLQNLNLIASENYPSKAVLSQDLSFLDTKYAEGYPGARYYSGCKFVDQIEQLALDRSKAVFDCAYANVQPWSGSQANQAVFEGLLSSKCGEGTILSLKLSHGGHLTHGSPYSSIGKQYKCFHYELDDKGEISYEKVLQAGKQCQPDVLLAGYTSFSGDIDWSQMRDIANELNCFLHADISHTAGLIAGKAMHSPVPYADVITSTTHKTLRGPRGGLILSNRLDLATKLQRGVFPGIQGGPSVAAIAAKAACFLECMDPSFQSYAAQVIVNAQALAKGLLAQGISLVNKNPKNHTVIINLLEAEITGSELEYTLMQEGICTNKNLIPNDHRSAMSTSGLRLGTAALTSLGFLEQDMLHIANIISDRIRHPKSPPKDSLKKKLSMLHSKNCAALKAWLH